MSNNNHKTDQERADERWELIKLRLMQVVSRSDIRLKEAYAVVSIAVMIDPDGVPCFWAKPKLEMIEANKALEQFIASVGDQSAQLP